MASYRFLVQKLFRSFKGCEFLHVPRAENEAADTLAKIASSRQAIPSDVSLEHLREPSVKPSPDSDKKIKPLAFREGDLVLRLVQEQAGQHKLSPPWEGPFIVSRALRDRNAYYLIDARKSSKRKKDTVGEETTRPWNAELLRLFYS
nr:uncharacterized protein LOC109778672 [Aegilops tauschii subsp. strangulata]